MTRPPLYVRRPFLAGLLRQLPLLAVLLAVGAGLLLVTFEHWRWGLVVVGTSLKVPPASTLPGKSRNRVICNLQWTRYDATAAMKIHARADEAMTRLCEGLGVEVPEYDARSDPVGAAFLASDFRRARP